MHLMPGLIYELFYELLELAIRQWYTLYDIILTNPKVYVAPTCIQPHHKAVLKRSPAEAGKLAR